MPLQLFFNELSVAGERLSRAISIDYLKQAVTTIRQAHSIDAALVLNTDVPLNSLPLCDGVTVASIRNAGECVEESLYLKTIANRAPMTFAEVVAQSSECRLNSNAPVRANEVALGLWLAHLLGLGISLASHEFWRERSVELAISRLDDKGDIITAPVFARNADSPAAIMDHADALRALLVPSIADGSELWERRAELFPNLAFIPRTRSQLEGLLAGDPVLAQAQIKLNGINQAIETWKIAKGFHPLFPFNVRPESRTRRAHATFKDADGCERVFSDHCDLAPTEGRIHFIVEADPQRRALIGHVGRKLGIG